MADEIRNCAELDEHLASFVDGEAAPGERRAVAAHLAACPPCQKHADAEAAAREALRSQRAALCTRAPEALRARCANLQASALPTPSARPSTLLRRWAPLSLAAT